MIRSVENKLADLSMCKNINNNCPKANSCHRFLAEKSEEQIFMKFHNICKESNNYKWYWEEKQEITVKVEEPIIKEESDTN